MKKPQLTRFNYLIWSVPMSCLYRLSHCKQHFISLWNLSSRVCLNLGTIVHSYLKLMSMSYVLVGMHASLIFHGTSLVIQDLAETKHFSISESLIKKTPWKLNSKRFSNKLVSTWDSFPFQMSVAMPNC